MTADVSGRCARTATPANDRGHAWTRHSILVVATGAHAWSNAFAADCGRDHGCLRTCNCGRDRGLDRLYHRRHRTKSACSVIHSGEYATFSFSTRGEVIRVDPPLLPTPAVVVIYDAVEVSVCTSTLLPPCGTLHSVQLQTARIRAHTTRLFLCTNPPMTDRSTAFYFAVRALRGYTLGRPSPTSKGVHG